MPYPLGTNSTHIVYIPLKLYERDDLIVIYDVANLPPHKRSVKTSLIMRFPS